jgi:hypothetical protein
MPAVRAGGREYPFKFKAGDNIGRTAVTIDIMGLRVIGLAPAGHYDGAHIKHHVLCLVLIIDGPGGTEFFTGPAFPLGEKKALGVINGIFQWNRLGILHINGLALGEPPVVFIEHFFGALVRTQPAGDAFVQIHITGMLPQGNFEIALFPGDVLNFR